MRTFFADLTGILKSSEARGLRVCIAVAFLAGVLSILRTTFNLGYNSGSFDMSTAHHRSCCVGLLESFLIPITALLFVSALGLWWRKAAGFLISLLALGCASLVYLAWYRATLSIMRNYEVREFSQLPLQGQGLLTLNDATWWDVAVLSIVILIAAWQLKVLLAAL